jgi:hypothetical protein
MPGKATAISVHGLSDKCRENGKPWIAVQGEVRECLQDQIQILFGDSKSRKLNF